MQVVIRDSGRLQPRDVGWLGAEQRWTVGSLATAATFVSNGLGFAWLPRHMIERELRDGLLKPLPLTRAAPGRAASTSTRTRTNPWARPRRSSSSY
jgi:DNA-binding transcriptional LysR family regulator